MIHDARELPPGHTIRCDVCIVGGGPAGMTLALELMRTPLRVALIESGGREPSPVARDLSRGEQHGTGRPLHVSRSRGLGGTSDVWTGWCRPLDPIDFERRPWVERSGWPFGLDHLDPYYRRAHELCECGPYAYDAAERADAQRMRLLPLGDDRIATSVFHFSPATHFGRTYGEPLRKAANVHVYLHATAMELVTDRQARRVERVRIAATPGKRLCVEAGTVVLAAGGIENARVLLLSDRVEEGGLGNTRDLVGRCFMEHAYLFSAVLAPRGAADRFMLYRCRRGQGSAAPTSGVTCAWSLSERVQREEGLVGCAIHLASRPRHKMHPSFHSPAAVAVGELAEALRRGEWPVGMAGLVETIAAGRSGVAALLVEKLRDLRRPTEVLALRACAESVPRPANRVTLTPQRDALGSRRAALTWSPGEVELRSMARLHALLDGALRRAGAGRIVGRVTEGSSWPASLTGGSHHMGTTRMDDDPARGVVDRHSRVHGVANLYITGSSVFPTGGYANPTLTIVALALRLGEHLRRHIDH